MATIYQRKQKGSFYIDWREDGRRRQRSLKTRDRKIAERELRRLEARLALGITDLPNAGTEPISESTPAKANVLVEASSVAIANLLISFICCFLFGLCVNVCRLSTKYTIRGTYKYIC